MSNLKFFIKKDEKMITLSEILTGQKERGFLDVEHGKEKRIVSLYAFEKDGARIIVHLDDVGISAFGLGKVLAVVVNKNILFTEIATTFMRIIDGVFLDKGIKEEVEKLRNIGYEYYTADDLKRGIIKSIDKTYTPFLLDNYDKEILEEIEEEAKIQAAKFVKKYQDNRRKTSIISISYTSIFKNIDAITLFKGYLGIEDWGLILSEIFNYGVIQDRHFLYEYFKSMYIDRFRENKEEIGIECIDEIWELIEDNNIKTLKASVVGYSDVFFDFEIIGLEDETNMIYSSEIGEYNFTEIAKIKRYGKIIYEKEFKNRYSF